MVAPDEHAPHSNGRRHGTTIAVDAMGGDFAPREIVLGAIEAKRTGADVVLVGPEDQLRVILAEHGADIPIVPAPDVIRMDEPVTPSLLHRRSSLFVAAHLVATGQADAVVSAGNSAAIFLVAMGVLGTQPGIDRAAFGSYLPTRTGHTFILDIGANTAVKASNLVQFAIMGDVYVRLDRHIARPRVGLLSNGTEATKGTKQIKEAYATLEKLELNFIGNVEANQIFEGATDVVVCDGFTGNILIKGGEAVAYEILRMIKHQLEKSPVTRVAAAVLRPALISVKERVDYEEVGGAPVLGVNGVVINCHGRSHAKAVCNAISLADRMAREKLVQRIGEALEEDEVGVASRRRRLVRALHLRHGEG